MRHAQRIGVIIPARDEAGAIAHVIAALPSFVDHIVVADNGSVDATAEIARSLGAIIASEPTPGYGRACLAGLAALPESDIIAFVDGDFADFPEDLASLVDPIAHDTADLVIGSRIRGNVEPGALTIPQHFGNWLATKLIHRIWGLKFTDLGPFRAIRADTLTQLDMRDPTYGWTVEMQIKAAEQGVRALEVPARYRRRIGQSKISGTIRGTVLAGTKILGLIAVYALRRRRGSGVPQSQRNADDPPPNL